MFMRCASERECLCSYAECGYDAHCAPLISCVSECTAHLARAVLSRLTLQVALSLLLGCPLAHAQAKELPAVDALPGIYRVGVAETAPAAVASTLGYGYTEPQNDAETGV